MVGGVYGLIVVVVVVVVVILRVDSNAEAWCD